MQTQLTGPARCAMDRPLTAKTGVRVP